MPTYSSDQFYKDWRFAIGKDFHKHDGTPFDYAKNGLQEWGQELHKLPFKSHPTMYTARHCAISDDLKYIATNSHKYDVLVTNLEDPKQTYTLRGHLSNVDNIFFRPGHSSQLISSSQNMSYGSDQADAQIIFWDLAQHEPNQLARPEYVEGFSRNAANLIIAEIKAAAKSTHSDIDVNANDQKSLADALVDPISELVISKGAKHLHQLAGHLVGGFQSEVFSRSGSMLVYRTGNKAIGKSSRELRVYSMDRHEDIMSFTGFTDSVMWTGFNHRETLLGAAAWDGSFRIWEIKTGILKHVFETGLQNWTAGFSPCDRYFAGTSGDGHLHVYDLTDGSEHMSFAPGAGWSRALSWHPDGNVIALGGESLGRLHLINIHTKEAFQHRLLSDKATKLPPELKRMACGFLALYGLRYIDGGRKIAFFTSGDGSVEVYDLKDCVKWRFARAGTMNPPDDDSEVTSKGGFGMVVREDPAKKRIVLASVDADAIRLWFVPMSSRN